MIEDYNTLKSVYKVFRYAINNPTNVNVVITSSEFQIYEKTDSRFKSFVEEDLSVYYLTDLGLTDETLNANISSSFIQADSFFMVNVNTHSEHFLCYSATGQKIDIVVWIDDYTG